MLYEVITLEKSNPCEKLTELSPLGMDEASLSDDFRSYYTLNLGRDKYCRSRHYIYEALALTLRDRLMERWKTTRYAYDDSGCRRA